MICLFVEHIFNQTFLHGDAQFAVRLNGRQFFTHLRQFHVIANSFSGTVWCNFFHMLNGILNRPKYRKNFYCCLLPHAGNSRNIIRGIPHKAFEINNLGGGYMIFLNHLCCMIIFYHRFAPPGLRNTNQYGIGSKLQKVSVTGYNGNSISFPLAFFRHGSKNVICLNALLGINTDIHSLKDFL